MCSVDSGVSDGEVSETVGTETNHSVANTSEDLSAAVSETLLATSESIPYVVEMKTNDSTQVSACDSAEGLVTQVVDNLNNHKNVELDELSHQDKLLQQNNLETGGKTKSLSLQGCKQNVSDGGIELKQPKQGVVELSTEAITLRTVQERQDESTSCSAECDRTADSLGMFISTTLDSQDVSHHGCSPEHQNQLRDKMYKKIILKCILCVDDIVLIEELREKVNFKFELWRQILESNDFHLSRSKIENMHCNFSKKQEKNDLEVFGNGINIIKRWKN
ncbi:hypothetical protein CR513_09984, partial [Mucuna pruriens]